MNSQQCQQTLNCFLIITFSLLIGQSFSITVKNGSSKSDSFETNVLRHRNLENEIDDNFQYDLSQYSASFVKCQNVKMYDDDVAQNEDMDTVFTMKHFVVFRLCPTGDCGKCNTNYGEYVLEIQDYLDATANYQKYSFEEMCNQCEEYNCDGDDENCAVSSCSRECWKYENLNTYGYVDATNYVQCQQLDIQNEDYADLELYIGPRCSSDGSRVYIGLFYDEDCSSPFKDATVEQVIGYKISYHLLKNTYSNVRDDCISCNENQNSDDDEGNDNDDLDNVNEMCEQMYEKSAKCESYHGIPNSFVQINRENDNYENQVENEFKVCAFIDSLVWGSYTENGEINLDAQRDFVFREVTLTQRIALAGLAIIIATTSSYAMYMQKVIEQKYPSSSTDS